MDDEIEYRYVKGSGWVAGYKKQARPGWTRPGWTSMPTIVMPPANRFTYEQLFARIERARRGR